MENAPGEVVNELNRQAAEEGCADRVQSFVVPAGEGEGAAVQPGGDTPQAQQAPDANPAGQVGVEHGPHGEPGDTRQPTESMHDRENPQSDSQIRHGEQARGATPQQADESVERARRGEPTPGESRPTHAGDRTRSRSQGGDPVDLFTGLLTLHSVDLDVPTPFLTIQLQRVYLSGRPYYGPWGFNWDHNWNVYLRELSGGNVARWSGRLHEDEFRRVGAAFEPPRGVFEQLRETPGPGIGYTIHSPGGTVMTFTRPTGWTDAERIPLVRITDRAGNNLFLTYGAQNRLERVFDDDGRGLWFTYGSCGLLEAVEDHAGRRVQYLHDREAEHLVAARLPVTRDFPEGLITYYEYDARPAHIALRHNVRRIIDHDHNTILQNFYEEDPSQPAFNRVVRQIQGGFFYDFTYRQLQWVPDDPLFSNTPAMQTTATHPDRSLWTYTFNYAGELLDERFRLNHDGSFRVSITKRTYDTQGNLTSLTRPDGSSTNWRYDDTNPDPLMRGNALRKELRPSPAFPVASRIVMRVDYDPAFQLPRRSTSENGAVTRFVYDFDVAPGPSNKGTLLRVEWPDATLPDGTTQTSVTRFETNARGQTVAAISPEGNRDELLYEPSGSMKAGFLREYRADRGGADERTRYDYDSFGFLSERMDAGGSVTRFRYNRMGSLEAEELPAVSGVTVRRSYFYNTQMLVARAEHPRGAYSDGTITDDFIVDTLTCNPLGHTLETVVGTNTAAPRRERYRTDFCGRAVFTVAPDGTTTQRCHDERGLLLFETHALDTPAETMTRYVYDVAGRLVQTREPLGRVTRNEYDPFGRVARVTLPSGTQIRNTWSTFDLPLSQEVFGSPGDGQPARVLYKITYQYDERGRVVRQSVLSFTDDPTLAAPLTEVKTYDRDGRCVRRDAPRGAIWTYVYDGRNRLRRETDPLGNLRTYDFGPDTLPSRMTVEEIGPGGPTIRFVDYDHDARKRLVRTRTSTGAATATVYDDRDLPVERHDETGLVMGQTFGLVGELLTYVIDPGGLAFTHNYIYDAVGRVASYRDPAGQQTLIERDPLGRVVKLTLADASAYTHLYDAAGDVIETTTGDGSRVEMQYDAAGRMVRLRATPGPGRAPVPTHDFDYDGVGRVVKAATGPDVVLRRFDSLGRLVQESCDGRIFNRTYNDLAGNFILRFPDGREEEHAWDLLGRVNSIRLARRGSSALGPVSGAAGSVLLRVEYRGQDRVETLTHGNGVTSEWKHDDEGRLLRVEHVGGGASLTSARYRYNAANRRRVCQITGAPVESHLYDYDRPGRLVSWRTGFPLAPLNDTTDQPGQSADISNAEAAAAAAAFIQRYSLDGADTRASVTTNDGGAVTVTPYTRTAGHKVTQVDIFPITHDGDGRRLTDATRNYVYDALGRVARIDTSGGGLLVSHLYDPLGRWSGGQLGASSHRRFYMGETFLQEESGGAIKAQRTHHPMLLMPSAETRAGGPLFLHLDGHQSLILATNSAGTPVERYRYADFGHAKIFNGAGTAQLGASALGLHPFFAGMQYLEPAGLFYTPKRHYDPTTGLFLARDPFLHLSSASPYVFANHDPVNLLDPEGDIAPLIVAGLVLGAIGAVVGMASVIIRGGNYDAWDVLAAGAIGFGAGFIGGVTFGAVSTAVGGVLIGGAGGATATAGAAGVLNAGLGVNIVSGVAGGLVSGGASGVFSGGASATYQWTRHGGDLGSMVAHGAYEEGVSGMVGGAIGGGLFQGGLRAGVIPRGAWAGLWQGSARLGTRLHALGRGVLSPYGLGAAGIGFASAYGGGVTRRTLQGESFGEAASEAWREGLVGAGTGLGSSLLHPTTWQYWRARVSTTAANNIQSARGVSAHHQRNVAQYPEFATPRQNAGMIGGLERWYGRTITQGNLEGPFSEYTSQPQHRGLHEMWRFGQTGGWTNWSGHGPWTPAWNVHNLPADPRPSNHTDKEN